MNLIKHIKIKTFNKKLLFYRAYSGNTLYNSLRMNIKLETMF